MCCKAALNYFMGCSLMDREGNCEITSVLFYRPFLPQRIEPVLRKRSMYIRSEYRKINHNKFNLLFISIKKQATE